MSKPAKIHVGLISRDKRWDLSFKEGLEQIGGGYLHSAPSMLDLYQKMGMQKIQLIAAVSPAGETGAESQAIVNFFRGKRDYAQTPICLFVEAPQVEMRRLFKDTRVRGYSLTGGLFLPLLTMKPMVLHEAAVDFIEPIGLPWIQKEFLTSIQSKIGQGSQFQFRKADDDDVRSSFFSQFVDEVRSHLGWFKFSARILDGNSDGLSRLFAGLSPEGMEETALILLTSIVSDFKAKVSEDLRARGALFFPVIEELPAPDRKLLFAGSRSSGFVFESNECRVVLEVIQYI